MKTRIMYCLASEGYQIPGDCFSFDTMAELREEAAGMLDLKPGSKYYTAKVEISQVEMFETVLKTVKRKIPKEDE